MPQRPPPRLPYFPALLARGGGFSLKYGRRCEGGRGGCGEGRRERGDPNPRMGRGACPLSSQAGRVSHRFWGSRGCESPQQVLAAGTPTQGQRGRPRETARRAQWASRWRGREQGFGALLEVKAERGSDPRGVEVPGRAGPIEARPHRRPPGGEAPPGSPRRSASSSEPPRGALSAAPASPAAFDDLASLRGGWRPLTERAEGPRPRHSSTNRRGDMCLRAGSCRARCSRTRCSAPRPGRPPIPHRPLRHRPG